MPNSLLAGAVAFLLAGPASAAQLILQKAAPGDAGTFQYTIVNPATEGAAFFSAQVVPGDSPALEILPGSDLGPHDIPDGAAYTYSINYRVKDDAPSGPAVLLLTPVFVVAAQDPRRPPVVTPNFVDAMGVATVLVDRGPAMLLAENARFSRLPTLAQPNALYEISGTANDDMWLGSIVMERLDGPNPGPVGAYPPPPAQGPFDLWTSTSPYLFSDLEAGLYSITARDIFGQQSKLITVRFQEINRVDEVPFDCRAEIGSHFGGQGPRKVEDVPQDFGMGPVLVPRYAEVAALSGLAPSRIPAAMTLGTLIEGVQAEQASISNLKNGGSFAWGSAASFAVGRTEAPRNRYLDLHAIPPGSLVPISEGMLLPGGPPRVRLELTGMVGDAQVVRRARIFDWQYGAWFLATGDSPPVFGAAQVAPADESVTVHPEGRSLFIRFQPTVGRGSLGTVRSSIQGLNLDPLCGFNSGTPVGSTVATHIDVDPVLEGPALVALPLEPTMPDAEQALVQVRLQTSSGTENVTLSVDPATDTVIAQVEVFGTFEIVVATGPDKLPPVTVLGFSTQTPRDTQGLPVVGPSVPLPFVVTDAGEAASGPLLTEYRLGAQLYVSSTTPLGAPGGTHEVRYRSWDGANNLEKTRRETIRVDDEAPVLSGLAPSTGVFGGRFTVSWTAADLDPMPATQAFLVRVSSDGLPVAASTPVPVSNGQELSAATLDPGLWVLDVTAADWVGNAASARSGPFEVVRGDILPPRSSLAFAGPRVPGFPAYVTSSTLIWLETVDDLAELEDGLGVGVATKSYRLDPAGPFRQSPATFTLTAEGIHAISFFSEDLAGNIEAVQVSSVAVDATPPAVSFTISGSSAVDRLGRVLLSTSSQIVLSASDPVSSGVASGLSLLRYRLNAEPEVELAVSSHVLQLPEGAFELSLHALDRVENRSVTLTTSVIVDVSPPAFGTLLVAATGSASFNDASVPLSTTAAEMRISVQDLVSGLDITGAGSGPAPLSVIPGTLGLWRFDEGSGSVALSAGGTAGNGTLNFDTTRIPGVIGGAVKVLPLDGISRPDGGVTLGASGMSAINSLGMGTVELWARMPNPNPSSYHTFTVKQRNGSDTMFWFTLTPQPNSQLWHPANHVAECMSPFVPDPTRWYHLAATWDGTTQKLYVDGTLIRNCPGSSPVPNDPTPTCLSIAGPCGDMRSAARNEVWIDEVRVMNRALSAAEVAQDASGAAKPFAARLSTNGGLTFGPLTDVALTGTDGTTAAETLSARGLNLKASTGPQDTTNLIEFVAKDLAGREAVARRVLLVNLNAQFAPLPAAPADGFSSSAPLVGFSWSLDPKVPALSITGYEFQRARDASFTQDVVTLPASTNSLAVSLPEGAFYWRVRAKDNFGSDSPYSAARRVFVDSQAPAISDAEVSTAPGAAFRPAGVPVNSLLVDVRASARDLASGLRVTPLPGGPSPMPVVAGTLGLWRFDEPSGLTALDAANVAGSGTINPNVSRIAGQMGGGVRVTAAGPPSRTNAGVTLAPSAFSVINAMNAGTIEAWVRIPVPAETNYNYITVKQHNGSNTMFWFAVRRAPPGGATERQQFWHPGNFLAECAADFDPDPTRWYHLTAAWDNASERLYIDGQRRATCAPPSPVPDDTSATCLSVAGACGDGVLAEAGVTELDEIRILNRALPEAEILADAAVRLGAPSFSATLSTDGGLTFRSVDAASVTLTGTDGTTSTETLTARGLALVESRSLAEALNVVKLTAADLTGLTTSLAFAILVDTTQPAVAVSSPEAGAEYAAGRDVLIPAVAATDRLDPAPAVLAELVSAATPALRVPVSTGHPVDLMALDAGDWELVATASDFAGNVSTASSGPFSILHDALPPRTTLIVTGSRVQKDGRLFVTPQTQFWREAEDDRFVLDDGQGLGVAQSSYSLNSPSDFALFDATFTIQGEALYDLRYRSVDVAGNVEAVRLSSVAVDGSAPETTLAVSVASRTFGGTLYVRGVPPLRLNARDRPAMAVGTAAVYLAVDGAAPSPVLGDVVLAPGTYDLAFAAVDLLDHFESTKTARVKLDGAAPAAVTDLRALAVSSDTVRLTWTAPGDDGFAGDIADAEVRLEFGTDPGALAQSVILSSGALVPGQAFALARTGLAAGTTYYARVYTRDTAGHLSQASALASARTFSLAVSADNVATLAAPVEAQVTEVPLQQAATVYTVALEASLVPVVDFYELTSGLFFEPEAPAVISFVFDWTQVSTDAVAIYTFQDGAWTSASIFNQTVELLSGSTYLAQISGEILHTSLYTPMVRDTSPPLTSFSILGSSAVLDGRLFVVGGSSGVLVAQDQAPKGGTASGVASTLYKVGDGPEAQFNAPFGLPEGGLSVAFRSTDRSGNVEELRTISVFVDASAPTLEVAADQPTFPIPGGFGTAASSTTLSFLAADPEISGARAGLAAAAYVLNGTTHPLSVAAEPARAEIPLAAGTHRLVLRAEDRLGHRAERALVIVVGDTVPPITAFAVAGASAVLEGRLFAVGGASGVLSAQDFAQDGGAPSGVEATFFALDAGPEALYAAPFPLAEGLRAASFFSRDRSGNVEEKRTAQVFIDASAPSLAAALDQPVGPWPGGFQTVAPAAVLTISAQDPEVSGARSGLALASYVLDGQTGTLALSPGAASAAKDLSLGAGIHNLSMSAEDRLGHQASQAWIIAVGDIVPPETTLSVQGSSGVFEGRLYAAGGSSAAFSAEDKAPEGGQPVGVTKTLYKLDGVPEAEYAEPFEIFGGRRLLSFHSVDKNGNAEEAKSAEVFVDTAAPVPAFAVDAASFTIPGGFGTLASNVTLTFVAQDPELFGARVGLGAVSFTLDGQASAVAVEPGAARVETAIPLGPGLHLLSFRAADRLGHVVEVSLRAAVGDTQPPVTTLSIGVPKAALPDGVTLVAAQTPLSLSAEDFAESGTPSGVAETRYRFLPDAFGLYGTAFTAPTPDGDKTLEFFSADRAGNVEAPAKSARLVRDGTPPAVAFAEEPGLCRLAQGRLPVRGSVNDAHLASWNVQLGAVLVGSGTAGVDGLLGAWDASGLSGPFDLTLSAADLVENAASATMRVYAGAPAQTLALGGKGALNKPRGVAAGPNRVYVADTNNDSVRVYDAQGTLLASFGDKKGPLKLNKPAGLAVDAAGNIYLADRNNKRIVKLSPSGMLLNEFGGKKVLERPSAVALVPGKVLVADSHAGELVVFTETGALLTRVSLPPTSHRGDNDDDDDDDEDEARPMALAADAAGNVWVADAEGGRAFKYDASLNLVQTMGGFRRPEGLAVSRSGICLAVADAEEERVRTFDAALGTELAAFGQDSLRKPAQVAFTSDGQLLVADRNADMVQGFGVPGTPLVVAVAPKGKGGFKTSATESGIQTSAVSQRIGRLEGGRVEHPSRAGVDVPAGALVEDQDISVAEAAEVGTQERQSLNLAAAGAPREFGPHGLAFAQPVTIILPYDPALLAGAAPAELKVHYWNAEKSVWEALDSTVDEANRTVSARVTHFSVYQVLAPVRALAAMADPEASFALRSVYVFPNPAVRSQKPTVHVAVGRADKVTIRFFDVAGAPAHEVTLTGAPQVIQDETGPHYAYEYAWDGHIPSGVYFYTVTAEKAGHAPIKRAGKLGVVR